MYIAFVPFDWTRALSLVLFFCITSINNMAVADGKLRYCLIESKPKISLIINKGNNKITELRTILQRESQNS
jgi:hypothetical protein